ncbi:MAG: 4Fe-4S dicluster domain-containing protein [Armatimonadota bacterium]|nr:MAG: 4Fe-4S dicluster domain-containing protein [Armatimonadota bacterium]
MVVRTDTPEVLEARKVIVELLLARCPQVEKLRELADQLGVGKPRFEPDKDDEKCILCGLCVRACQEVVGVSAINFLNRGPDRIVTTPYDMPSDVCIACGACAQVCPTGAIRLDGEDVLRHRELDLGPPKAIHVPFAQAVPNAPIIDTQSCIHAKTGFCKVCDKFCEPGAINHDMEDESEEIEVGSIILATGFEPFDCSALLQYGYGRLPNVITGLEFELMSNAGGPTGGKILTEDGKAPASVGILHCIGSRDENYNEYCSRVCCMYAMKFAHLVREKTHGDVYEFYIDLRAFGKGYEEFYKRCLREDVIFIRGKGAEVTDVCETPEERGKLVIICEDTLLGEVRRIPVDMVILATGLVPRKDAAEVGRRFSVGRSKDGFFLEQHPKLAPISTASDGIFLAGACQGPKDIPDSVAQGAAAAGAALSLSGAGVIHLEPITSAIDDKVCGGCKICISVCPYGAITFDDENKVSVVTEALCKGCGSCASGCPSGAARQRHFADNQILAEIAGALMEGT